jgi:FkbH-like protein
MDQLFALLRSDEATARYPEIRGLLHKASEAEITQAGRFLARLDVDEVQHRHPDTPAVTAAITGHGTLPGLEFALTGEMARHGILLRPHLSVFSSYVFELSDPDSPLYRANPDVVLCVLDASVVFDEVPVPWQVSDVARVLREKVALLERLVAMFASHSGGTLVLNTMPLPRRLLMQLVDYSSRSALGAVWREANARLLRLTEKHPSLVVFDLDALAAEGTGLEDIRLDVYAKAHLAPGLLAKYAREAAHLARGVVADVKKVLVLDLDNTVWGGVLGDDGPAGIEVGGTRRGEAFAAFQKVLKQLGSQGLLLAAVSKNDAEPVRAVLRDHPDMVLREQDFAWVSANWRPKPDNIRDLAQSLGLRTASFVFTDDSAFECDLVRQDVPDVAVIQLDGEPALHVRKLLDDGWFDTREVTAEDRNRTATYRQESDRADFLRAFESTGDYLRALELRVDLSPADAADLPRLSQLTLRTNQFNLTSLRMQPSEVQTWADDPAAQILAVRSADRFGDNGLVGALFLRRSGGQIRLANFVLSCRVFSRCIETAVLATVLRRARDSEATEVLGFYRPNGRNDIVAELYPGLGFRLTDDGDTVRTYRHDLDVVVEPPAYIQLTGHFLS